MRIDLHPRLTAAAAGRAALPLHDWNEDYLESKRAQGDLWADELVEGIFASGQRDQINSFYQSIQAGNDLPAGLSQAAKDYFSNTTLPAWTDEDLLRHGEAFYIEHGAMIALILCIKSLPESYACAKGAMVLHATGRLLEQRKTHEPFTRRITETAQFIVNVMAPGGVSEKGKGVHTAQKIRLIHASVRYYLKADSWADHLYGKPVNQEDLAGTLMAFSSLVIEGLEKFGIEVSPVDKEAYFHSWRVVGHFMGIDEDLLPNNYQDGLNLGYAILKHQQAESEQGRHLTASLIEWMRAMMPVAVFDHVINDLLRFSMGDELSDLLAVPGPHEGFMEKALQLAGHVAGHWENFVTRRHAVHAIARPLNKLLLNTMLKKMNGGERVTFYIPDALRDKWDLDYVE